MVRALGPRKFIEDGKLYAQGRVRGAKTASSRNFENATFFSPMRFRATVFKKIGPAGGWSLSARIPLMVGDVAYGDDSLRCVGESYKQSFCHGVWSRNFGLTGNPRHGDTFWSITMVWSDGFR